MTATTRTLILAIDAPDFRTTGRLVAHIDALEFNQVLWADSEFDASGIVWCREALDIPRELLADTAFGRHVMRAANQVVRLPHGISRESWATMVDNVYVDPDSDIWMWPHAEQLFHVAPHTAAA